MQGGRVYRGLGRFLGRAGRSAQLPVRRQPLEPTANWRKAFRDLLFDAALPEVHCIVVELPEKTLLSFRSRVSGTADPLVGRHASAGLPISLGC